MSLLTNWDYTICDPDSETVITSMDPMLTAAEFDDLTAGKYGTDERIQPNINAASSAIRNYCGWHVYPSYPCEFNATMYNGSVKVVRGGILIQLPAKYVSAIESITIGDSEFTGDTGSTHFVIEPNGIVRVFGMESGLQPYTPVCVKYTAGVPDGLMDGIKELVAHRVTHALASSGGIQSETAGGVSITYSANWTNSARSTALADDNKEVVEPYRLRGVF